MRSPIVATTIATFGIALMIAACTNESFWAANTAAAMAAGGVLAIFGVLALATRWRQDEKNGAFVRLDVFLPFLKKRKKNAPIAPPGLLMRSVRRIAPQSWLSNPEIGKPGLARKLLKKIGPTVYSAPLRRAVQTVCFGLFLALFFYVCWPYSAHPQPPGKTTSGWRFVEINQASGAYRFERAGPAEWPLTPGTLLYVIEEAASQAAEKSISAFEVLTVDNAGVSLTPQEPLPPESIDAFLLSTGSWSFHESPPGRWPSHYADELARKERLPAEMFLAIDPLVSLSTAIAARSWVWSLASAAAILLVCILIPRGFCGYLCPLGTLIDLFDWAIGRRVTRFRVSDDGWWVHIKYYLLLGVLICALLGVLVSGYVAAIPVVTRGMLFLGEPLQSGLLREWRLVAPLNAGHAFSIALFLGVLGLGLLKPRFWCKYVCPSGAVFSLGNLFRLTERKVESSCINCNKCVEICPFDAIKPDFTTRVSDCTLCQTCGGVCPTHAIKFVERWNTVELKVAGNPPTHETPLGRRGFLSLAAGTAAAVVGGAGLATATRGFSADPSEAGYQPPVRPPGSVPEREFLQMCIRCGECFKACPNNVLQAMGFHEGWNNLWTPQVVADWAGCDPSCNACGQVCPTGAIRALPLVEKKAARMGLAIVNPQTCLPFAGREACQLCVDECAAAGYDAIEFTQVHTQVDEAGQPLAGTGFLAPVVLAERCVGCGVCQTRCFGINAVEKGLLAKSAIVIVAGDGKEDRMIAGSYLQLREEEARQRDRQRAAKSPVEDYFVPGMADDDPFGIAEPDATGKTDRAQQPGATEEARPIEDGDVSPF